jgi:hypothetical protein
MGKKPTRWRDFSLEQIKAAISDGRLHLKVTNGGSTCRMLIGHDLIWWESDVEYVEALQTIHSIIGSDAFSAFVDKTFPAERARSN